VKYMSRERTTEWLLDRQSLAFNLAAASFSRVSGFLGLFEREVRALAEDFAAKYDVTAPSVDIEIEALSGGNRQKAVLARLASSGPRFLLLDEPFSGVDQPTRFRLFSLLRKLASDGMGIIIYSQESRDLVSATDRIAVMLGKRRPLDLLSRETAPEFVEHLIVTGDLARRETV
jgi:ABC-type sugar transport system ATPase subunit